MVEQANDLELNQLPPNQVETLVPNLDMILNRLVVGGVHYFKNTLLALFANINWCCQLKSTNTHLYSVGIDTFFQF